MSLITTIDLLRFWREQVPGDIPDPIQWGEDELELPSSARAKRFDSSITPWIREPIYRAAQGLWLPPRGFYLDMSVEARIVTLVKPVQSGGSTFGELILLYWICFGMGAQMIQYNWKDNDKAKGRWESRIAGLLAACRPVRDKLEALGAFDARKCEINFGNVFFRMQGAFTPGNLDSDSVPFQINEELHDWEPGHLDKARNRSNAVALFKSLDISNAGARGDQLDQAFCDGTAQQWEVKCPGCGKYHQMRTRWEDKKPNLGGLRYDATKSRLGKFKYDYNKLRPTIRFQMPCGFEIHNEDMSARTALSQTGKYSEPTNKGAELTHRSYTYQAVCVDYLDWMEIIKKKHNALRARSFGDIEPWRKYTCEVECIPYDPDEVPINIESITVTPGVVKNREGLPEPKTRMFALDRQQGQTAKNEFPHWWLVIADVSVVSEGLKTMVVYEGKVETDEQVVAILAEHKCNMWQGCADSGDDTTHVYLFCLKHGINAIKGGKEAFYSHQGNVKRIYSPERPLHAMLSREPLYPYVSAENGIDTEPDLKEPLFWLYSKSGIRERYFWLRGSTTVIIPDDVSEDFIAHQDAEERKEVTSPADGSISYNWVQIRSRNDQFVNMCYIAMMIDMAGGIGEAQPKEIKK